MPAAPPPDVLPDAFLDRLAQIVPPARLASVLASFTRLRAPAFRVNTLRAAVGPTIEALRAEGLAPEPVAWHASAFWVPLEDREPLLASRPYREQAIYVQNLSSMVPPRVLGAGPGERVLDLCAAPGSKTLQLAAQMQGEGELAAVELVRGRYYKLRDNLAAQGAGWVRTFNRNGETVWRHRPDYFDRVLVDAPCSTEGRFFTGDPETFAYWSPRKIKEMVRKQRRLLYSAVQSLRVGGVLVYSTCSFAPEENEGVVAHALQKFGGALEPEPLGLTLPAMQPPLSEWKGRAFPEALGAARRLLPDERMEAFFVCRLRKTAPTT